MECSDGVTPFVKQDAYWKKENTNSDELELDFEPNRKENAISSLLSIQSDVKTEESNQTSLTFSAIRNGGNLSQNENNHTCANADSTNDETVVTSTNKKPESRVAVPTGLLLYRLFNKIIIEALLSSNNCVDGSKYNSNDTNNNNSNSNKAKGSASGNAKVDSISNTQEWVDKHYLIFKSNALSVDSTMENPTDKRVDNVTKDVPVDNEMNIVNETTVTNCLNNDDSAAVVNNDQHRVVNRESVVVLGGSNFTDASYNHRIIDSLDARSDSAADIPVRSFTSDIVHEAYFDRLDLVKGFNDDVKRCGNDTEVAVENLSKSVDAVVLENMDEHYSSDGCNDEETDSESDDSDFMSDNLAGSSVTSVKLVSDADTLVKRRSIIDDKIINDVFECFKRKLIETINNEIILSLNADRRQNVVSSCDAGIGNEDYMVGHFNDDARTNAVNNNCVNDVGDDVNDLNTVILEPVDVNDVQKNFNFNVLSGGLKLGDSGSESIAYDNMCGADSVSHKESSALKRKFVAISGSSVSTDYISCSATDTNYNQIKKIKVDTLKAVECGVDEAVKQYSCTNCNTKRKFVSGSAYGKRKRYDCKTSDKGYVSDTFPYDVDGLGRSGDEKSEIVSESILDVNDCKHYDCNRCCKVFNDLNVYKNHKIYCRDKNFDCNLKLRYKSDTDSDLHFDSRNDRSDEVRGETDSCLYVCNVCGALSQDDELFNVHLASHSLDNQLYYIMCQLCDRRYYVKSLYLNHLKTDHKKLLCKSCNGLFDSDQDLNDHARLCNSSVSIFSGSDAQFEQSYSKCADVGIGSCHSVSSDSSTVPIIAKNTVKQNTSTIKDFQNI